MGEKGLGMGLGALFGEAALSPDAVSVYLSIDELEAGMVQPRRVFDGEALEELAESIREHGIIQPLTVRKSQLGGYQIIAGERRWRAARLAGLKSVPARIIEADDRAATEMALVENLQREDLNPVEEAQGYRSLIENYGLTQDEAAKRVGKSRPAVANSLRLLDLPFEILAMMEDGELSAGHCRALLPLSGEQKRLSAAKTVLKNGMNVRETENYVKKLLTGQSKTAQTPKDIHVRELEQRLTTSLGRRVLIHSSKKKGRLEMEYYGNEDLDRLIEALEGIKRREVK